MRQELGQQLVDVDGKRHGKLHVTIEPRIVVDFSFCTIPILSSLRYNRNSKHSQHSNIPFCCTNNISPPLRARTGRTNERELDVDLGGDM